MLIEHTLWGVEDKVKISIERLKTFEPPDGYYLAFSGGKDSVCAYQLAKMAGVKFDAHYNFTTCEPPELVQFIKKHYPDVIWSRPERSMWQLIVDKRMPPTRLARYCCQELKESGGEGRVVVTGVRRAESVKRSKRGFVEKCNRGRGKSFVNPILDWTDLDVWEFIHTNDFEYCSLYSEGWTRVGCVGCPFGGKLRFQQFRRWPNFEKAWKHAIAKCVEARKKDGLSSTPEFSSPEAMWKWWMEDCHEKDDPDQTIMFE